MPFKIRDLIITVLPQTIDPDIFAGPCDAGTEVPPGPPPPPGPDEITSLHRPDILELRMQLQIALALLGGPVTAEEMRPRSIKELDALEQRLKMAMEEIGLLRSKFMKQKGK